MPPYSYENLDRRPNVVSLFTGAGGLDLGLAASGFQIRYESDIDPFSCATLAANGARALEHGLGGLQNAFVECADVLDLTGARICSNAGLELGDIDLLAGGPPCQAFSVFGRRAGIDDRRGQLVFEYARLLAELRPRAFIFENVYGLLTVQKGAVFQEVLRTLADPGDGAQYEVSWQRVNAREFGVPQSRDRILIFGIRCDANGAQNIPPLVPITVESPVGSEELRWRNVEDSLRGLPSIDSPLAKSVPNHQGRRHGTVVASRYAALAAGERDGRTRINRLDATRPSFTIVVGSDAGGGKGHVHPTEPRELTPRESARIQTFPDWWAFEGNVRHMIRQVGNAVPALLGFAIGNHIRETVFGLPSVPFSEGVGKLGQSHLFAGEERLDLRRVRREEQLKLSV